MRLPLTAPLRIGDVEISNRVLLAPLAGIGNWFVRLQARRHGAGMAFSEMVSSFALHHRNPRTLREMLVVHPEEHPVAIQLFGQDPDVMRSAAGVAAGAGAAIVDINMGCPVRKVRRTGAGAELLADPGLAIRIARGAVEGAGGRPVSVKLRSGLEPGDRAGVELAERLVREAGVSAIALHPRPAAVQHKGDPEFGLVRELVGRLEGSGVPVIVSGGLGDDERVRRAYLESGADAVMIARGALGNPWIFGRLTGRRGTAPSPDEVVAELMWVIDRAGEHLGARAPHYLRKFYPWYLERLRAARGSRERFQRTETLDEARALAAGLVVRAA
jgi:nifR3 family TIM-barrel protein